MAFEHYVETGRQRLRCGYTTGTCAAAAARGAAEALLTGSFPAGVAVETPAGVVVEVELERCRRGAGWASCGVRKDAGDDRDATDGILVEVRVERSDGPGCRVEGGRGVGTVTRPGLDQPVGAAAVNSVPRAMIVRELEAAAAAAGLPADLVATVGVEGGEELAAQTFNPRLGIEGGISILGTTGIVRPMSEEALAASIRLELKVLREGGLEHLVLVPGNYGHDWACGVLGLDPAHVASCSNFLGEALDAVACLGFSSVLLVGHAGKLVKAAGGAMNTHSRVADGRAETLAAHAALAGARRDLVSRVMGSATTDEACGHLADAGLLGATFRGVTEALARNVRRRVEPVRAECVVFSKALGELGRTDGAEALERLHRTDRTKGAAL